MSLCMSSFGDLACIKTCVDLAQITFFFLAKREDLAHL
jgi:hypothetical protein